MIFPVVSEADSGFKGLLTRSELMAGLSRAGRDALVAIFAKTEIPSVEASSPLIAAIARLREGHGPCLQVVDGRDRGAAHPRERRRVPDGPVGPRPRKPGRPGRPPVQSRFEGRFTVHAFCSPITRALIMTPVKVQSRGRDRHDLSPGRPELGG